MRIALHSDTGQRLVSIGGVDSYNAWRTLKARIAAEYSIPKVEMDEAIRIDEDDDGIERVTVDGKPVGYVVTTIGGVTLGEPAPVALAAE
jgi:hypothetical protein